MNRPVAHGTLGGALESGCDAVECGCHGARRAAAETEEDRAADFAELLAGLATSE